MATTQQDAATKLLWCNPEFAARYKLGERVTGGFAGELVQQLDMAGAPRPINMVDLASGLGIAVIRTHEALKAAGADATDKDKFTCTDLSGGMLNVLKDRAKADSWPVSEEAGSLVVTECSMTDTKLESNTYSHLTCTFGPGVTDADKVIDESFRILRSGGQLGYCQWKTVGWVPDFERAFRDIRAAAEKKAASGQGSEEDKKLSKLPPVVDFEFALHKMAGGGELAAGEKGWASEGHWKEHIEAAGFKDVVIRTSRRPFSLKEHEIEGFLMATVNVLKTFWTAEERTELENVDLRSKLAEWFGQRFKEPDVKDGTLVWDRFVAMVITARKP